jgi:hypothetical protein
MKITVIIIIIAVCSIFVGLSIWIDAGVDELKWILPTIALVVTIIIFTITQWKTKRIESAKLILGIEARFLEKDNKEVSKQMDAHFYKNTPFDVGVDETDDQRRKIYNYLSELEVVCQYHEDGIMTTTQVYELLGSGIIDVMRIDPIVDLIEEDRKKPHQADLYDNLQKTFGIMIDHQNKKFKKNTPENIREFVNKKLQ